MLLTSQTHPQPHRTVADADTFTNNMAPKKRRAAAAGGAETHAAVIPDHLIILNKRLEEIDAAGARTAAQQHDVRGQHHSLC